MIFNTCYVKVRDSLGIITDKTVPDSLAQFRSLACETICRPNESDSEIYVGNVTCVLCLGH